MISKSSKESLINTLQSNAKKDLHIHSYYSDGELSPEQIVDRWMEEGYQIIAISDHDGIEGSRVAFKYAEDKEVEVIPAIEFDSDDELGTKLHILGYGIDYDSEHIKTCLELIQSWRDERNQRLSTAIADEGFFISDEELYAVNNGRFIGKPTFAQALVNKGEFSSVSEVFDKLIKKIDEKGAFHKQTLQSKDVIDVIHRAGGIAVLAHPMEQKKDSESYEEYLPRLIHILDIFYQYGIDGIECYHPSSSIEQSSFLVSYAINHGLIVTRGSDFHGDSINRDFSKYHK